MSSSLIPTADRDAVKRDWPAALPGAGLRSHLLGVEKPDPAIFKAALADLELSPAEALYIGDVFYADAGGANRAGLGCVHLDPGGLYKEWPGVHLPDVRHLPGWLAEYTANPAGFDLFPGDLLK